MARSVARRTFLNVCLTWLLTVSAARATTSCGAPAGAASPALLANPPPGNAGAWLAGPVTPRVFWTTFIVMFDAASAMLAVVSSIC